MKIMLRHLLYILLMGVFVLDSQSLLAAGKSSGGKSSGDRPSREQPSKDRSSGGGKSSGDKPSKETSGGKSSGDKPLGGGKDSGKPSLDRDSRGCPPGTSKEILGCFDVGPARLKEEPVRPERQKDSKDPMPRPERDTPSRSYDFSSYESAMQSIKAKEEEAKQERQKKIDQIQQNDQPMVDSLKKKLSKIGSDTECFPAHTKVHMADGQFKDIETIEEGDEVVSCHLSGKGECIVSGVKKVIRKTIDRLVLLKTSEGVIEATGNHPFYVYDRESGAFLFKEAKDLTLEDILISRHFDGTQVRLIKKMEVQFDYPIPVYNLSLDAVEGDNNYFVGEYGLLVHNCGSQVMAQGMKALAMGATGQQCFSSAFACMASGMAAPATGGASAMFSPEACSMAAMACGALGLSIFSQNHGSDSTKQEDKGNSGKSSSVPSKDIKEAERALKQNKDFRDWFHREYKQDQVQKIKDRHNPDLSPEQIYEAYKEWQEWGNPKR